MAIICHKETIAFALVPGTPASLGESPVWDSRCGGLWWVDPEGRRLSKSNASTGRARSWERPEMPCFAVLTGYGDPAVSMESGIFVFSERDVRCERIAELGQPRARFNDATVDASGRLWAATMDRRPGPGAGALYSISQNGRLVMHIDGISWPNGLACDGPHDRLYFPIRTLRCRPLGHVTVISPQAGSGTDGSLRISTRCPAGRTPPRSTARAATGLPVSMAACCTCSNPTEPMSRNIPRHSTFRRSPLSAGRNWIACS